MRLLRLDLLRYGHLDGVALEFPPEAALHVVLGANEAGKSTALEAIGDALFGIPVRSARDFQAGGRPMRLGFVLQAGDGAVRAFLRRKGRGETLMDEAETPLPESALRPFLGDAGRDVFARSFGLDGPALRQGGEALLKSGGEAGESLLAGLGLSHLRTTLDALDAEARSLHGDGRGRRRLAAALDAHRQARRALDDAAVRRQDWDAAEAEQRDTAAALAALQEEQRALSAEGSRLQRIRRVVPLLRRLDDERARLLALADAPHLPPDTASRLSDAREAARDAARDAEREAAEILRLEHRAAGLAADPAVLAQQDAIDLLAERRAEILRMEAEDLPPVLNQAAGYRASIAAASEELDPGAAPDALRARLPPAPRRRALQQARDRRIGLLAARHAAAEALTEGRKARDAAQRALDTLPAPPSPLPLRQAIDAARGEGPVERELATARREADAACDAAGAALAALPLWQGAASALAALPLPLPAAVDAAARALATAREDLAKARDALVDLDAEAASREAEASALAAGETVPTPTAVAAARASRDETWRAIRRALATAPADPAALDGFEALRDAADRLADRRAEQAQRVAAFDAATARLALLQSRRSGLAAAVDAAEAALATAEARWRALWSPSGLLPGDPAAMVEWCRLRDAALALDSRAREAGRRRDSLAERVRAARGDLAAAMPATADAPSLSGAIGLAEARCAEAEAAAQEHRTLADRLAGAEERLVALREAATRAEQALADDTAAWSDALAALGLGPEVPMATVDAALAAWNRIAEVAPAWDTEERRIGQMRGAIGAFAQGVRAVLDALPGEDAGAAPGAAVLGLQRRLAAARAVRDEAARIDAALRERRDAAQDAARRAAKAAEEIADLVALAGAAAPEALDRAIARAAERDDLVAGITGLERDLAGQGDGRDEEALRAEAEAVDADAVPGRLAEIEERRQELTRRSEELGGARARCAERLARMTQGGGAAGFAQAAQDALAEARGAAERYARVHVARRLLKAGIERFRREQQSPLLRAAGGHLAALTEGRYARLVAEPDAAGGMLMHAVRPDGVECPVGALSEGARDQLFLALRVAGVERLVAGGTVLPFIADDLLATFDDARAAAALGLLAALGRQTQVILFTHHAHVADLARRRDDVAVQHLGAA